MLEHFPRPPQDNGRGVHWSHSQYFWGKHDWSFWKEQIQAMNLKWIKLLDDGSGSVMGLVKRLVDIKVMPVIRFYREEPNPGRISGREADTAKRYADMGAVYFETNNEPDLALEWRNRKRPPNWLQIVVDNFIIEADMIREIGGYLLFPAFGPGGRGNPFQMIVERGRRDILDGNCCLAIHNYCLGRPLDYPNDPINTLGAPLTEEEWEARGGMWAWEMWYDTVNEHRRRLANPNASIMEDSTCFRAFEYFDALVNEAVGHSIPIFTTEGGYNVGQRAGTTYGDDPRYPKPTPEWHGKLMNDMYRYIEEEAPDYYFTCMSWLIAVQRMGIWGDAFENQGPWFTHHFDKQFGLNGELPLVGKLRARPGRVRQDGPVPKGMQNFYTGPDLTGRHFDNRFKYLEPQVRLEPVADPSQPHWRLIEARWADETESGGKAYVYVKALDENRQPIEGATFQADRRDAVDTANTKSELDQYLGNILMTGVLGTYQISMAQDGLPSDKLVNVGLGNEVSPRDFVPTSFFLTFQKITKGGDVGSPEPETTPTPEPPKLKPTPTTEPEPEPVPTPRPELSGREFDTRLGQLEPPVQLVPVMNAAQPHWRLVSARWSAEREAQGRGYIFVRALDETGQPLEGVVFQADRGDAVDEAATKGVVDQYLGNYMMTGRLGTYEISITYGGLPSDKLVNVGLGEPNAPWGRTTFHITFQRVTGAAAPPSPPDSTPEPTPVKPGPEPGQPPVTGPRAEPPADRIGNAPDFRTALKTAATQYLIPVNPTSVLVKHARSHSLGEFLSAEFSISYRGVDYLAQVFERGIVYLRSDQPENVSHIPYPDV